MRSESDNGKTVALPGNGAVSLHAVNNGPNWHSKWRALELRNLTTGKTVSIHETGQFFLYSGSYFLGAVPAGRYKLERLDGVWDMDYDFQLKLHGDNSVSLAADAVEFTVESGSVTDLGTLVATVQGKRIALTALDSNFFATYAKEQATSAGNAVRVKRVVPLKSNTPLVLGPGTLNHPYESRDGTVYFGSRLGRIRARAPNGRWATLDTGSLLEVRYVIAKGKRLLATTERELLLSRDAGKHWESISLAGTSGHLELGELTETNEIYAVTSDRTGGTGGNYAAYKRVGNGWEKIAEQSLFPRGLIRVAEDEFSCDDGLLDRDMSTVTISSLDPEARTMSRKVAMVRYPKRIGGSSTIYGATLEMAFRNQRTMFGLFEEDKKVAEFPGWAPPTRVLDTFMRDRNTAYALLGSLATQTVEGQPDPYLITTGYRLVATKDNGNKWTEVKTFDKRVSRLFGTRTGILFAYSENGMLLASRDNGKTWKTELRGL